MKADYFRRNSIGFDVRIGRLKMQKTDLYTYAFNFFFQQAIYSTNLGSFHRMRKFYFLCLLDQHFSLKIYIGKLMFYPTKHK